MAPHLLNEVEKETEVPTVLPLHFQIRGPVITYKTGGGASQVLPQQKGGGGRRILLAMLKGGGAQKV